MPRSSEKNPVFSINMCFFQTISFDAWNVKLIFIHSPFIWPNEKDSKLDCPVDFVDFRILALKTKYSRYNLNNLNSLHWIRPS